MGSPTARQRREREARDEPLPQGVIRLLPFAAVLEDPEVSQLAEVVGGDGEADAEHSSDLADTELVARPEGEEDLETLVVREEREERARALESRFVGHSLPELHREVGLEAGCAVARAAMSQPKLGMPRILSSCGTHKRFLVAP